MDVPRALPCAPDQLYVPHGTEQIVVKMALHHLVGDLEQHVPVAALADEIHAVVDSGKDGLVAGQDAVLSEVEELQDDDHADPVAGLDDGGDPPGVVLVDRTVGAESRVVVGVAVAVRAARGAAMAALDPGLVHQWMAALEVKIHGPDAPRVVLRQRGDEPLRVGER